MSTPGDYNRASFSGSKSGAGADGNKPALFGRLFDKITEAVGATRELLYDGELRKKAVPFVLSEGTKALQELQKGLTRNAAALRQAAGQGVSSYISKVLERAATLPVKRRSAALDHDKPVNVWVGRRLVSCVAQQFRSRMWCVLVDKPELLQTLGPVSSTTIVTGLPDAKADAAQQQASNTSVQATDDLLLGLLDIELETAGSSVLQGQRSQNAAHTSAGHNEDAGNASVAHAAGTAATTTAKSEDAPSSVSGGNTSITAKRTTDLLLDLTDASSQSRLQILSPPSNSPLPINLLNTSSGALDLIEKMLADPSAASSPCIPDPSYPPAGSPLTQNLLQPFTSASVHDISPRAVAPSIGDQPSASSSSVPVTGTVTQASRQSLDRSPRTDPLTHPLASTLQPQQDSGHVVPSAQPDRPASAAATSVQQGFNALAARHVGMAPRCSSAADMRPSSTHVQKTSPLATTTLARQSSTHAAEDDVLDLLETARKDKTSNSGNDTSIPAPSLPSIGPSKQRLNGLIQRVQSSIDAKKAALVTTKENLLQKLPSSRGTSPLDSRDSNIVLTSAPSAPGAYRAGSTSGGGAAAGSILKRISTTFRDQDKDRQPGSLRESLDIALQSTASNGLPENEWELLDDGDVSAPSCSRLQSGSGTALEPVSSSSLSHINNSTAACVQVLVGLISEYRGQPQERLFHEMMKCEWEEGRGLSYVSPPNSDYFVHKEIDSQQEEVNDIILRDIHRTFPEHPMFQTQAGQEALFRLLKAYSLHDPEVGYCQGMAFAAGVMLMYLPEEVAFRLYRVIMGDTGANLRRLYLPGLQELKDELATFDRLLFAVHPELQAHLEAYGIPPVLYVSQWIMTVYASPFPPSFTASCIEIMLQDGHDAILLRVALAIMDQLAISLLALNDFEALLTHIKVAPAEWDDHQLLHILTKAVHTMWEAVPGPAATAGTSPPPQSALDSITYPAQIPPSGRKSTSGNSGRLTTIEDVNRHKQSGAPAKSPFSGSTDDTSKSSSASPSYRQQQAQAQAQKTESLDLLSGPSLNMLGLASSSNNAATPQQNGGVGTLGAIPNVSDLLGLDNLDDLDLFGCGSGSGSVGVQQGQAGATSASGGQQQQQQQHQLGNGGGDLITLGSLQLGSELEEAIQNLGLQLPGSSSTSSQQ